MRSQHSFRNSKEPGAAAERSTPPAAMSPRDVPLPRVLLLVLLTVVGSVGCGRPSAPERSGAPTARSHPGMGSPAAAMPVVPAFDMRSHWWRGPGDLQGVVHWPTTAGAEMFVMRRQVTDPDLQPLAAVAGLTRLDVAGTPVTDAGLEHFRGVTTLLTADLSGTQVTDRGLLCLEDSTGLYDLRARDTMITDVGIAMLDERFQDLRFAFLSGTPITDRALEHLARVRSLVGLDLRNCRGLTAEGLRPLLALPELRNLAISETGLGDEALAILAQNTCFEFIDVGPGITDAGLRSLAGLTGLEALVLSGREVTDQGIQALLQFPHLQELTLRETAVTEAGLRRLVALPQLRTLHLMSGSLSDQSVAELRRLLPDCNIIR